MLKEESEWIEQQITVLLSENVVLYPVGNVGCSDDKQDHFQPWVKDLINFIDAHGVKKNIDIKDSSNVDLVGDLLDDKFILELKKSGFNSVLCANIITNIKDKNKFAKSIVEVIPIGGVIIATVSNRYPYVADPVDTLYRPNPKELAALFPNTVLVSSQLISSDSYARLLWRKKKVLIITLIRIFMPFYKPKTWLNIIKYLPDVFKPVRSSCVVLKKI